MLHLGCLSGNLNIVQYLVEKDGLDTEIKDKNGKKAADLARNRGYTAIVDFLTRWDRDRKAKYCNLK